MFGNKDKISELQIQVEELENENKELKETLRSTFGFNKEVTTLHMLCLVCNHKGEIKTTGDTNWSQADLVAECPECGALEYMIGRIE